eukprot:COSAG01_NODE_17621_length_1136_cov_1.819672_1_plen_98_part_10
MIHYDVRGRPSTCIYTLHAFEITLHTPQSDFLSLGSHDDACIVAPLACKSASATELESAVGQTGKTVACFTRAQNHEDQEPPPRAGGRPQDDGHDEDG